MGFRRRSVSNRADSVRGKAARVRRTNRVLLVKCRVTIDEEAPALNTLQQACQPGGEVAPLTDVAKLRFRLRSSMVGLNRNV
jgi:hypothetical protein